MTIVLWIVVESKVTTSRIVSDASRNARLMSLTTAGVSTITNS